MLYVEARIIKQHTYVVACSLRIIHIYKPILTYNNPRLTLPDNLCFYSIFPLVLYKGGVAFTFLCINFVLTLREMFKNER